MRGGLLVSQGSERVSPGQSGILNGATGNAGAFPGASLGGHRTQVVVRQLGVAGLRVPWQLFQRGGDRPVRLGAPTGAELAIQCLADEGMCEDVSLRRR